MNKWWEVWREGYNISGNTEKAFRLGVEYCETFQEACDNMCAFQPHYNKEELTVWGCRLFDNEQDARRSFG